MNKTELINKVIKVKTKASYTNCYRLDEFDKAVFFQESDGALLFVVEDHGIKRLYYFAENKEALNYQLSKLSGNQYYIEIMTKEPDNIPITDVSVVSRLMRVVNIDCRNVFDGSEVLKYRDDNCGFIASKEDVKEANCLLWSTFHTEVSHLLFDEELGEYADKNQLIIHRSSETGIIDALLQIEVMPRKFYINQVINLTDKSVIHAMLLNQLWIYTQQGGKYLYSWVEENNIASIKFHKKYGMNHDGMWNIVYCLNQ